MSAPLPAPLPPPAMPPPSAPTAAPPRAPMPASFAALTIFSLRDRSGPLMSPATRLHSATTDCGGTPLLAGAAADGAGVAGWTAGVGAWATVGLAVVEGDADGAATFVSVLAVRFATTMPVTTKTMAAITSPIDVIFHMLVLSSAMALSSRCHATQLPCKRLSGARGLARQPGGVGAAARRRGRLQRDGAADDQDGQRLRPVAQGQLVARQAVGPHAGAARDGLGDDQLAVVVLRQRLEPAGDVDRVADGREIDGLGVAHAADDGGARVDPD